MRGEVLFGACVLLLGCGLPEGRLGCSNADECPSGWYCRANMHCYMSPAALGIPCSNDTECWDGVFCNGEEKCGASSTCERGVEVSCVPDDACHTSTCSETRDMCLVKLIDHDGDEEAASIYGECGTDCDDYNDAINSAQSEVCGNDIDDDCDPTTDDDLVVTYYRDCDSDGFAPAGASPQMSCGSPDTCEGCDCTLRAPDEETTDCADNAVE